MALTLTREEALQVESAIDAILKREGNRFEFEYALVKNRRKLKAHNAETREDISIMQKELRALALEYCDKDDDGKPVMQNNMYAGLETGKHPEYDARTEEIHAAIKAKLKTPVELEPYLIKKEYLPSASLGTALIALMDFIEGEENGC